MSIDNSKVSSTKIDLSALKKGFKEYLEDKAIVDGTTDSTSSGASIFLHSEDFKNYLVEEIGLDKSVFSQDINAIMQGISDGSLIEDDKGQVNEEALNNLENLAQEEKAQEEENNAIEGSDNVDGSNIDETEGAEEGNEAEGEPQEDSFMLQALDEALVDSEVVNAFDEDKSGDLSEDEINKFLESANTDKSSDELTFDELSGAVKNIYETAKNELLDKVFEDKDVISAIDIDGDGKLSDEEKDKFKEFIKGYSNNGEELTKEDIEKAFNDIIDGKFDYSKIKGESDNKVKSTDNEESKSTKGTSGSSGASGCGGSAGGGSVGGGGGVSGGGGGSYGSGMNTGSTSPSSSVAKTIDNMSLEELEKEKTEKQGEVDTAQKEVDSINSGEKFKSEEDNVKQLEDAYKEALKNDENTPPELLECLDNIDAKEQEITDTKTAISDFATQEFEQENAVKGVEATLQELQSTQGEIESASSDDPEKQAEISSKKQEIAKKIAEVEKQVQEQKEALTKIQQDKKGKEEELTTKEGELSELNQKKTELEEKNKEKLSEETQKAMEAYNEAKTQLDEQKKTAETEAQDKLTLARGELQKVNDKINQKKAEETSKEYSVNTYDFDFELKLSDGQANDLETFKQKYAENKDKYEAVAEATGVPAELIAAIHWRESGGNFNTYLHNGDPLGQTTTHVPQGIYFEDWTEAAIDALKNHGGDISSIEEGNLDTYYDYAERYNGLGYRNKGVASPYVWAGTDKYTGGKYVADGVYDPNHYDQQLGVAAMLQSILS